MSERVRALVLLCAALGARRTAALPALLDAAAACCDAREIEEALLQSYLFIGFPGALNALALWRERSGLEASGGASVGAGAEAEAEDAVAWRARGEAVCAQVYAGQYGRLRANVARLHPDVEAWMLTEGYGKVLGRPGLDLATRELCIVALLVGQEAAPQLHAHLRGALNVGASHADVAAALELAADAVGGERGDAARAVWTEVARRRGAASPGGGGGEHVR